MASANLKLSKSQDIWDVTYWVEENSAYGNYRSITLYVGVRTTDFGSSRSGGWSVDCYEGESLEEHSCDVPGYNEDYFEVYYDTFDVYVSPGQTYADISFEFEIHFYSSTAGATRSLEGTITRISGLSVISDIAISSVKNIYFGDKCSVTWAPASSSFAYKLKFTLGSYTYTTGAITPNTTSSYTYTGLTVPVSAASNIPNSTSGKMSVTLTQYSSSSCSTTVGSSCTETFKVTLRDTVIPTIKTYSATVNNNSNSTVESWGLAIAGFSRVNVSATASGVYGSTIKSFTISGAYSTTVNGTSLNYTGDPIGTSGNKSFIITCTDSRGRVSSQVTTDLISFLPYTPPKVTKLTMGKITYDDNDASNDRMTATATWTYDSISGRNYVTAKVYYKVSDASDWTAHPGTLVNKEEFVLTSLIPDDTASYNFKVVITDALGSVAEKDAFSSTTIVLLDFKAGGDGLGIGKICENPGMEVSMDATFYNEVYIRKGSEKLTLEEYINQIINMEDVLNTVYPIGSIYTSVSSTSPALLFGGSWTQLTDRFLLGAGSYTAGATGGEATHTLTVNEMPKHKHWGVRRAEQGDPGDYSTGESSGSADSEYETDSAGGGQPHNNMPPYLVVYMWKRVA